jgi:glucose-1-phosphate thymidylyltransferase
MKAIILAAGFGTRLYPITRNTPKALLLLKGKLLIDRLMDNLAKTKPDSVTLITNNRFYEQFVYWKSCTQYPFPIRILNDGTDSPEERKGAVLDLYYAVCDKSSRASDTLVLSSDNYFDYPLKLFLLQALSHLPDPVIGVYDVKDKEKAKRYGVLEIDSNHCVKNFTEKPEVPTSTLVSVGIYLFPKHVYLLLYEYLRMQKRNPDRIGDFVGWLTKRKSMLALPIDGRWVDIGDLEEYDHLRDSLDEVTFEK